VIPKSIIIIGAGLSGLSSGIFAQINGFKSRIFEHGAVPGGVAASWKRQGYLIDGGIHFVMGHKPGSQFHKLLTELGVINPSLFSDMMDYGRFVDETAGGANITVSRDLDKLARELKTFAPADTLIVDELINAARAMRGQDLSTVGLDKPPELASKIDDLKMAWQFRAFARYLSGSLAQPVAEYVKDMKSAWLARLLNNVFTPEVPAWFIAIILAVVADEKAGYLARGSLDFVLELERQYKKLGGQVSYRSTVEEIITANNRAVGVKLIDGTEYRADYVISAGDGFHTIFDLLGGRYTDEKIKARYSNWPVSRPFVIASFGVKREFNGEIPLTTIILKEALICGQPVEAVLIRILNYSTRFAPHGKTVVQVEFESPYDYWAQLLAESRAAYDAEKERLVKELIKIIERHYPGIGEQIEMTDIATPCTNERYTLNRNGAWGGWLMTAELFNEKIERTLPGLENFFMAGQWVASGGMAPSLYSGRHAIQLVCHAQRQHFKSQR